MSLGRPDTAIVTISGEPDYRLVLPTGSDDPVVQAYLRFEPLNDYLVDALHRLVPHPATVLDLGCHVGTFTIAAAALGHRVIAIDAARLHVDLVRSSAVENGFDRVTVIQAAVSDGPGEVHFHEDGLFGAVVTEPAGAIRIKADSVPALVREAGFDVSDIVFIKADVEGSELKVLTGLSSHLAGPQAPPIVYESNPMTSPAFGFSVDGIRTALEVLGYTSFRRDADGLHPCSPLEPQPEGWLDLLALKPDHVSTMGLPCTVPSRDSLVERFVQWGALPHPNVRAHVAATLLSYWPQLGEDERIGALLDRLMEDDDAQVREAIARGRPHLASRSRGPMRWLRTRGDQQA